MTGKPVSPGGKKSPAAASHKPDPKTYLLRLSRDHAAALCAAVELYERISMGQLRYLGEVFEGKNGDWVAQREQGLDEACDRLRAILFPELHASGSYHGIMSEKTGRTAHLCYELRQEVRYRMAWTEAPVAEGGWASNSHYEPCLFPSGVLPRPQCASEDGAQPELCASGQRLAREIEAELGTTDIKEALRVIRELKAAAGCAAVSPQSEGRHGA